jgi:hypothetical protein
VKIAKERKWTIRERWQNADEFLIRREERRVLKEAAEGTPLLVHKVHQTAVTKWLARGWELMQSQGAGYVAGSMMVITIDTATLRDRLGV